MPQPGPPARARSIPVVVWAVGGCVVVMLVFVALSVVGLYALRHHHPSTEVRGLIVSTEEQSVSTKVCVRTTAGATVCGFSDPDEVEGQDVPVRAGHCIAATDTRGRWTDLEVFRC